MNRYNAGKNKEVQDLRSLRQERFKELAEIDLKILAAQQGLLELAEIDWEILAARQWLVDSTKIDRELPKSGDPMELAEIDRKILTAIIKNASDPQIEVDSGEVSPTNFATLASLGYRVERLPLGKTLISWKSIETAAAST